MVPNVGCWRQASSVAVVCVVGMICTLQGAIAAEATASTPGAAAASAQCAAAFIADGARLAMARLRCLRATLTIGPWLDDVRLDEVERAAWAAVHDTGDADAAAIVMLAAAERRARDPGRTYRLRPDYEVLLATGQWERAAAISPFGGDPDRTLVAALPEGAPQAGQAVYWQLDHVQRRAVARAVDLTQGRRVVVYAAPGCGFCVAAVRAIAADPHLHALMREHSLWISVPDINFRWTDFERWNANAPGMPLHLLRERRQWPQRRFSATPWFYLVEDGQVVDEHLGWLDDGPQRLRAMLAPLGEGAPDASAAGGALRR